MAVMLAAFSVLALYTETILQIYVIMTSHTIPLLENAVALTSLLTTFFAFLATSVASVSFVLASSNFSHKNGAKLVFGSLHALSIGFFWRIFRLILNFSDRDLKELTSIRLVHVGLQSAPYVVLYIKLFLSAGKLNVIQGLSIFMSVISSTLALTSYNLRHKLTELSWSSKWDGYSDGKVGSSNTRIHLALGVSLLGTFLVLSARLSATSLMVVDTGAWVLALLLPHFLLIFVISVIFRTRMEDKSSAPRLMCSIFGHIGMSILNTLDLVYANIDRVLCNYVGFYFLLLTENIVMLSFWLLGSELRYVTQLITVIGVLTCFILGLIAKFIGCNLLHGPTSLQQCNDAMSLATITTATTTTTSTPGAALFDGYSLSLTRDDDIVSIVQASLLASGRAPVRTRGQKYSRYPLYNCPSTSDSIGRTGQRVKADDQNNSLVSNKHPPRKLSVLDLQERPFTTDHTSNKNDSLSPPSPRRTATVTTTASTSDHRMSDNHCLLREQQISSTVHRTPGDTRLFPEKILVSKKRWNLKSRNKTIDCDMLFSAKGPYTMSTVAKEQAGRLCNDKNVKLRVAKEYDHRLVHLVEETRQRLTSSYGRGSPFDSRRRAPCTGSDNARGMRTMSGRHVFPINLREKQMKRNSQTRRNYTLKFFEPSHESRRENQGLSNVHGSEPSLSTADKRGARKIILSPVDFLAFTSSDSSCLSTTVTRDVTETETSLTSSSSLTSREEWSDDNECSATWPPRDGKKERRSKLSLPGDSSQLPSCENIMRWLAGTET